MKKLVVSLALMSVAAWAETWTGTISDAHCGAKHTAASEKDMACVQKCVGGGAAPVFISGDKVIKIANADAVKEHLGHKVTITGDMTGDSVTISKVTMAE
jgi:hypothetical protein